MKSTVLFLIISLSAALAIDSCEPCNNPNEEYLECGTACPKTCQNLDVEELCIDKCVSGCFCKAGFVRSNSTGPCISPRECSNCPKTRVRRAPKPILPLLLPPPVPPLPPPPPPPPPPVLRLLGPPFPLLIPPPPMPPLPPPPMG